MLYKFAVPYLLLVAAANGAVLPQRRATDPQVRDIGDILSGIISVAENVIQALPTDVSDPIVSLVDGLIDPTATDDGFGAFATAVPTASPDGDDSIVSLGGDVAPTDDTDDLSPTATVIGDDATPTTIAPGDVAPPDDSGEVVTPTVSIDDVDGADAIIPTPTLYDPENPAGVMLPGTPLMYSVPAGIASAGVTAIPGTTASRRRNAKRVNVGEVLSVVLGALPTNIANEAESLVDKIVPGALPTPAPSPPSPDNGNKLVASASSSATSSAASATKTNTNGARTLQVGSGYLSLAGPVITATLALLGAFVAL